MNTISFSLIETLAVAVAVLYCGRFIKQKIRFFEKYFIPEPAIGGIIFSLIAGIGHYTHTFEFTFDTSLNTLLMTMFFTSIGFMASVKLLAKGGIQVFIFLILASVLASLQNVIGVNLAQAFDLNPLIGLVTGSIPLTGGHGTSGAFGPILEQAGVKGATTIAVASATYGLIAGCLIGGPIAKKLLQRYKLQGHSKEEFLTPLIDIHGTTKVEITEITMTTAVITLIFSMGLGVMLGKFLSMYITLPIYIGPMIVAALIRNIYDFQQKSLPMNEIAIVGDISLMLFLSIVLMTMKLWELAALAIPLVTILLAQTLFMAFFAYFITFTVMGKDYDAAVMSTGHCGFGLGATPNAMANMESFTQANGPSPKAFMVIPLVGALFIDFTNALIITFFINHFK